MLFFHIVNTADVGGINILIRHFSAEVEISGYRQYSCHVTEPF